MEKKTVQMGHNKKFTANLKGFMENLAMADQKSIAVYVGQNGSGKTLVLIFQWVVAMIGSIYLESGKSTEEYIKILQFIMDKSFDKNDFTGTLGGEFENMNVSFELEDGKVKSLDIDFPDPNIAVKSDGMPVFMSKSTRLFSDVVKYHKLKQMMNLNVDITLNKDADLIKLCEFYKFYDICFMERMRARLSNPKNIINPKALDSFKETLHKEITNVTYDELNCDFIIHETKDGVDKTYSANILSAGEQAWVNMFINV